MSKFKLRPQHWITGSTPVAILLLQHLLAGFGWVQRLSLLPQHESTVVHVDQFFVTSKDIDKPASLTDHQPDKTAVSTTVTVEHRRDNSAAHKPIYDAVRKFHVRQQPSRDLVLNSSRAGRNSSSISQQDSTDGLDTHPSVDTKDKQRPHDSLSNTSNVSTAAATPSTTLTAAQDAKQQLGINSSSSRQHSILGPVLAAAVRSRNDPFYYQKLKAAASKPITIAVMTGLFWQLPTTHTEGCKVDGIPLDCRIQNGGTEEYLNKADTLYYHVPSFAGQPRKKAFPEQLRIAMSLESSAYYPNLDSPRFMCQFDAEMTYTTCAQVTNWYSLQALDKLFSISAVPFDQKLHAIAYINSNCDAQSGRSAIMRKLMALGDKAKVPVHSLGKCDNNKPWPSGGLNKVEVMRKYKFCVAMENSIRQDYMTEKMWDGLMAGCIPIYMGSSNAPQIIPDPNSVIVYDPSNKSGHASTPEQLDAVMHEIGSDQQRYEAMLAWKHRKPEEQPSEIFRYLWDVRKTIGECFLCQFLARHRAEPKERYTTCLFNKPWMESAGQPYAPAEKFCQ